MQCDHLGPDHASVIQNREVSLIRRSVIERFHCNIICRVYEKYSAGTWLRN